jgi:hypothetical protein
MSPAAREQQLERHRPPPALPVALVWRRTPDPAPAAPAFIDFVRREANLPTAS